MYATYHPDYEAKVQERDHVLGFVAADSVSSPGTSSSATSSLHGAAAALCSSPIVPFLHSTLLAYVSFLAAALSPLWSAQLCPVLVEDPHMLHPLLSLRTGLQISAIRQMASFS